MQKIYLIGNAHIDPVWLWRWQEGFSEIKATFRSALDRLGESEDFIFTSGCACYYAWIEKNAPEMFEEIRRRVLEGRWSIVGGWWLQPDCNLPSGESFARHALYAQGYFYEKFGKRAAVGYNVDSFGHNGNLPQLLKMSGLHAYVMMRPADHEKELPPAFLWRGNDGTEIPTAKVLGGYNHVGADISARMDEFARLGEENGLPLMLFYGVGNHGGGPTISLLNAMRAHMAKDEGKRFVFSDPDAYFAALDTEKLPVVHDDLQHHASGCYSAVSEIKAVNRLAENRLALAERMMTVASALFDYPYEAAEFRRAWQTVLFQQFHDILGGCSIREAYQDALHGYGEALHISGGLLNEALQKISWLIDTLGGRDFPLSKECDWITWEQPEGGAPIVVFNPHAWAVRGPVELNRHYASLTDEHGVPVRTQRIRASRTNGSDKYGAVFLADLPPLGYRVFFGRAGGDGAEQPGQPDELAISGTQMSNEFLRVTFDEACGCVKSLYEFATGHEVFAREGGARAIVVRDEDSDTWAHGIFTFREDIGAFSGAAFQVLEEGPIRATMRVTSSYGDSSLTQDFTLYRGISKLYCKVRLDWREQHKILKLSFPIPPEEVDVTYEIPYGVIARPANGEEEPGQAWVDIAEKRTGRGLTLANTAKYSYDALGGDLRVTAARGAIWADHYGERDGFCEFMDQGEQTFAYVLSPHSFALSNAGAAKLAAELNLPPIAVPEAYHKGTLPLKRSFASTSAANVLLHVLKRAEDGKGTIVRLCETDGFGTETMLKLPFLDAEVQLSFRPYEVKTVAIGDDGSFYETDFVEWELGSEEVQDA